MIFKRDYYINKLINNKNNSFIKVITGIRRCGKSYLLFNLYYNYLLSIGIDKKHIIAINLENDEYENLYDRTKLREYIKSKIVDNKQYYLFLDEIQNVQNFEKMLNGLNQLQNLDIYVTGSNSKFLSTDIITEFRGRSYEIRVYPLSFAEFFTGFDGEKTEALMQYMLYGGMPALNELKTSKDKSIYLKNLFDTVYLKDIMERYKIKNIEEINEIINFVSSSIGSLTNPTKLEHSFESIKNIKISKVTIQKYLNYLKDSFLIDSATRYDIKGKRYINTPLKYYFTDVGLRNVRIDFRQYEQTHLMENIIFNELKIRDYNVDIGVVEINTKNKKGVSQRKQLEVDFVCNQGNKRYYIQSAFAIPDEEKMRQETNSLVKIKDSFKKIVVVNDDSPVWRNNDGILIINIKNGIRTRTGTETIIFKKRNS